MQNSKTMDVPFNWFQALHTFSVQNPPISFIANRAMPAIDNELSVYLPLSKRHDLQSIRDWFASFPHYEFALYGRTEPCLFDGKPVLVGYNFVFSDLIASTFFRLRW